MDAFDGLDAVDVVTGVVTGGSSARRATDRCGIPIHMSFEVAMEEGRLEEARALLEDLALEPETGGLCLPERYADLAQAFDRRGQHDDAIASLECAIAYGWSGRPDPHSDIAEFHLRAGRRDEAARIWEELKAKDPEDVWLYNAAGLSYSEVGDHELAVAWLAEGIELAIRTGDPEGIVPQFSEVRRSNLAALGHELDELERHADEFVAEWRDPRGERTSWADWSSRSSDRRPASPEAGETPLEQGAVAVAMAWFPSGEYEKAIELWESLAEDWAGVAHPDYCRRMDGHIKWMRAHGVHVRAVAPIVVDKFVEWCEERGEDPDNARAGYAADRYRLGGGIDWPPGRNEPCWCGSGRKYKRCCGLARAAPMHSGPAA